MQASSKPSRKRGDNSVIIGKKVNEGVLSFKGADLTVARYVGRVALGTTADDIRSSLQQSGVDVVALEAISVKHNRFSSFKLVIKKLQLKLIENPDLWPEGVIVGRWWLPKATATTHDKTSTPPPKENGE